MHIYTKMMPPYIWHKLSQSKHTNVSKHHPDYETECYPSPRNYLCSLLVVTPLTIILTTHFTKYKWNYTESIITLLCLATFVQHYL